MPPAKWRVYECFRVPVAEIEVSQMYPFFSSNVTNLPNVRWDALIVLPFYAAFPHFFPIQVTQASTELDLYESLCPRYPLSQLIFATFCTQLLGAMTPHLTMHLWYPGLFAAYSVMAYIRWILGCLILSVCVRYVAFIHRVVDGQDDGMCAYTHLHMHTLIHAHSDTCTHLDMHTLTLVFVIRVQFAVC